MILILHTLFQICLLTFMLLSSTNVIIMLFMTVTALYCYTLKYGFSKYLGGTELLYFKIGISALKQVYVLSVFQGRIFKIELLESVLRLFLFREGQCAVLKKHYFVSSIFLKAPSVAALVCSGLTGSIWKAKTKHQGYCCKRSLKTFRFPGTVSLGSNYTGCIWKNRTSCYS